MAEFGPPSGNKELREYAEVLAQTFAGKTEDMLGWISQLPEKELRVWREKGRVIAGLTCYRIGQFFGGKSVTMGGVAGVVVTPHARKGGAGSGAMRALLAELHEEGVAISTLYPATQPMYRRLGYEVAGSHVNYSLPINAIDVREHGAALRPATDADEKIFADLYRERAFASNGNLDRNAYFWRRKWGKGDDMAWRYIIERDGKPAGYVIYRAKVSTFPRQDITVSDFVARDALAARRLLAFFAEHRSVGDRLLFYAGPMEPLLLHLAEQKHKVEARWDWMTRIVNVKQALEQRGYPKLLSCEVHLDVRDELLPENAGKWRLRVEDGKASAERGGKGKVKIDVRGLSSLYSAAFTPHALAGLGLLEASEADMAALNPVFAGPAPWTPDFF